MYLDDESRWRKTDESNWLAHCRQHADLALYYGRIYTRGMGFNYSETNRLITNLKIPPQDNRRLTYKQGAINTFVEEVSDFFDQAVPEDESILLVPIPPSKTRTHPEYDDRLEQVADRVAENFSHISYTPLLYGVQDVESFHRSGNHRAPEGIYNLMAIDCDLISRYQEGNTLVLIDDVLTSGAHFSAARRHLLEVFPSADIVGVFWAKAEEPEDFVD